MEMSSKDKHVNNWKFVSNCRFLIWFRKALHTPQSLSQLHEILSWSFSNSLEETPTHAELLAEEYLKQWNLPPSSIIAPWGPPKATGLQYCQPVNPMLLDDNMESKNA